MRLHISATFSPSGPEIVSASINGITTNVFGTQFL